MLGFQTVQGKGRKETVNHGAQGLGGIAVIPVFPGETVAQFRRVVIGGVPDETDGADDKAGFPEGHNPGRRITCPDPDTQIPDK